MMERHRVNNKRKNIKMVMRDERLGSVTKTARAEEEERLARLARLHQEELPRVADDDEQRKENKEEDQGEEHEDEDPNNSGLHVNDALNVPNAKGNVLVNVGHPDSDRDALLAPQLAAMAKPHQIGGIRFLYDNIIESEERFRGSQGFGCILAHSMGLGKTFQVVAFIDIFLAHTGGRKVLCIVPINTIQNWLAEFNYWLPAEGESTPLASSLKSSVKSRNFPIYLLNDSLKSLQQRAAVIEAWQSQGGVLLMGYELYRQLANRKARKRKVNRTGTESSDADEENRNLRILSEVQK